VRAARNSICSGLWHFTNVFGCWHALESLFCCN
jgi:hypothetical protein